MTARRWPEWPQPRLRHRLPEALGASAAAEATSAGPAAAESTACTSLDAVDVIRTVSAVTEPLEAAGPNALTQSPTARSVDGGGLRRTDRRRARRRDLQRLASWAPSGACSSSSWSSWSSELWNAKLPGDTLMPETVKVEPLTAVTLPEARRAKPGPVPEVARPEALRAKPGAAVRPGSSPSAGANRKSPPARGAARRAGPLRAVPTTGARAAGARRRHGDGARRDGRLGALRRRAGGRDAVADRDGADRLGRRSWRTVWSRSS